MNYIKNYSITFNASSLEFQSTPSVGRATMPKSAANCWQILFQSTPSVGRATFLALLAAETKCIFQSTPSVGRATRTGRSEGRTDRNFNPRPPWGGRQAANRSSPPLRHFNPRPPWGGRLGQTKKRAAHSVFQSTPSVGRATNVAAHWEPITVGISIHALRGEGD